MKHPWKAEFPIEAFTGITREQTKLIAHNIDAFDFCDEPSAAAFRDYLIEGLVEGVRFAHSSADANSEDLRAGAPDAPSRDDELFEWPYILEDLLEKVRCLADEQVLILFGHQLGLQSGRCYQ